MKPTTPPPVDRRTFLRAASAASAAGVASWTSASVSPLRAARQQSPNERVIVAVMGVNGRGDVLARSFAASADAEVAYICEVDERILGERMPGYTEVQGKAPQHVVDFRRALEDPQVDAVVIAAPDHWHAPATLLALSAGKHVYVEKPASHGAREGELMVEAQRRHGLVVQMGNQQRSDPRSIAVVQQIRDGLIGRAYYARAWYSNTRESIGRGQPAAVPSGLDYELWQGPAPRTEYRDNRIHYNWHWFWNWGTGEVCNNGTHEIDVARWALDVQFPSRVTSTGGRYHYDDDWQCPDTQDVGFDFDGKSIVWQGRSCNGFEVLDRGRGVSVHGTDGTIVLDRNGFQHYDADNALVRADIGGAESDALDTRGAGGMTDRHIANFLDAIRTGAAQHSPIEEGHNSTLLCHLGNIAHRVGRSLQTDPQSGRIRGDEEAMKLWTREYEPGWEPVV